MNYPKELRPQPSSTLLTSSDISDKYLLRETHFDLYSFIKENEIEDRDDFHNFDDKMLQNMIDYPSSSKEVYELSLYLFGVFNRTHLGLELTTKEDKVKYQYQTWKPGDPIPEEEVACNKNEGIYPIFFEANKLSYSVDYNDQFTAEVINTFVSFEHMPNLINFWHFQLFSLANNQKLTRSVGKEKYSRLAKVIIQELFVKALVIDESNIQ